MNSPEFIQGSDKVIQFFGYWPEFCDAKIEYFSYSKVGSIELRIFYIDSSLAKSAEVHLRFNGVSEATFDKLFSENVVDEISFEGTGPFTVTIDGCYGLDGHFKCNSMEVVNFTAKCSDAMVMH